MSEGHVLKDTAERRVVRDGDTVRRPTFPWTPAVHALLRHLEAVGFPYAPRVVGIEDGQEVLTYLHGESGEQGWPRIVDESGLRSAAFLLRAYHEAVADWRPDDSLIWAAGTMGTGEPGELICHGDYGPWNLVWQGNRPIGIIDWDYAHPAPARKDLTYALEYVVPFRSDAEALDWMRHPCPPDRRRRMEIFLTAYGLRSADGLVDEVIQTQRASLHTVRMLADNGIEPQATWARRGQLTVLERRIRWVEDNRELFR
jgi:Phosphotransferase enzyme family